VATPSTVDIGHAPLAVAAKPLTGHQKYMCGGCYFIYEPSSGLPDQSIASGTPFTKIPPDWRCPDCGTEKTTFRPYVEPNHQQSAGKRQIS
jgi:GntR family transcriptional regulator/MocR family aminotransferase